MGTQHACKLVLQRYTFIITNARRADGRRSNGRSVPAVSAVLHLPVSEPTLDISRPISCMRHHRSNPSRVLCFVFMVYTGGFFWAIDLK